MFIYSSSRLVYNLSQLWNSLNHRLEFQKIRSKTPGRKFTRRQSTSQRQTLVLQLQVRCKKTMIHPMMKAASLVRRASCLESSSNRTMLLSSVLPLRVGQNQGSHLGSQTGKQRAVLQPSTAPILLLRSLASLSKLNWAA